MVDNASVQLAVWRKRVTTNSSFKTLRTLRLIFALFAVKKLDDVIFLLHIYLYEIKKLHEKNITTYNPFDRILFMQEQ
jgi:hypothetical protein